MKKPNWIETRKECEIGENGELVTKKVTLELEKDKGLEKKELIDISLRFVSMLAIFIPVLLFFQQQKAERDKRKALFQLEIYSNVTTKLHSMVNMPVTSKEFEITKNELFYDIYPKLKLLDEKVVSDTIGKLKDIINFSYGLSTVSNIADSLNKSLSEMVEGTSGHTYTNNTFTASSKEIDQFGWLEKLNSGESKIRNWKYETAEAASFCKKYQQRSDAYIKDLQKFAEKLVFPNLPQADENKDEEFNRIDEETQNLNDFTSKKALFDDFYNKYDSTFKSYLQQHIIRLDSIMTRSSSFLYDR